MCVFIYFMAELCLSWGFLSAVVVVRHLCLHTWDRHSRSDRNLEQRSDLWTSAPQFGELWERSRAIVLSCWFWDTVKLCCFSGICFSCCWPITFWARSFMPTSFKILRNCSVWKAYWPSHQAYLSKACYEVIMSLNTKVFRSLRDKAVPLSVSSQSLCVASSQKPLFCSFLWKIFCSFCATYS